MLSPGEWHKHVPRDPIENVKFRKKLLLRAHSDRSFQKCLIEICRRDVIFFFCCFVWQYNPKHFGKEAGPFITWPFQEVDLLGGTNPDGSHEWGILECVEDQEDLVWQKSREMGVSWFTMIVDAWLALFHSRKKVLVISQDADGVDRPDDPDCLFWKIQFVINHLPSWMKEGILKRKMGFTFSATDSTINGEANTVKAGVGGRASKATFDEFGQFKDGLEIFSRTADTSDCRVFVFTHKSTDSMAYDLCFDVKYAHLRKKVTHWTKHPEKNKGLYRYNEVTNRVEVLDKNYQYPPDFNFMLSSLPTGGPCPGLRSPWYDKECQRRPARAVAMDLDIDPQGATQQFFDSIAIKILKNTYCCEPKWVGRLEYDEKGWPKRLVEEKEGLIKLWCYPKGDGKPPIMSVGGGTDLSWGQGATPTCLSFMSARTGEKILEYINAKIPPSEAAVLFVALCRLFVDDDGIGAKLCWEIQGPGVPFGSKVMELGYNHVYFKKEENVLGQPTNNRLIPGWNTSPTAIMKLLSDYRDALKEKKVINRSAMALEECLNFVFTNTSVEYKSRGKADDTALGSRIHHGDVVVADALAYKMVKELGLDVPQETETQEIINVLSVAGRRAHHEEAQRRSRAWA